MEETLYFLQEDGSKIYVEVIADRPKPGGKTLISRDTVKGAVEKRFSEALSAIKGIAEDSYKVISSIPTTPEEVSLEFGIKISSKLEAIIASSNAEAHLKVTLKWKPSK